MQTTHQIFFQSSAKMARQPPESIDLVVTSPPYPMITMWDKAFGQQDPKIAVALENGSGRAAFELMHGYLDQIWAEVWRVLKPGALACINIGDATRSINGEFALYPNHVRVSTYLHHLGFTVLPCILWRKQTNAPNKFMGSGMLPAGAYVTLEHEYILIFRKGPKREFTTAKAKAKRRSSAIFWEERNAWFSDIWLDIKGTPQALNDNDLRKRSAAFPFEVAYRLISMYSVKEDAVLDPFWGTGTTTLAAVASGRNSIGYEIDHTLAGLMNRKREALIASSQQTIEERLRRHVEFTEQRLKSGANLKYINTPYGFPVMTAQEKELFLNTPTALKQVARHTLQVTYSDSPPTGLPCTDG